MSSKTLNFYIGLQHFLFYFQFDATVLLSHSLLSIYAYAAYKIWDKRNENRRVVAIARDNWEIPLQRNENDVSSLISEYGDDILQRKTICHLETMLTSSINNKNNFKCLNAMRSFFRSVIVAASFIKTLENTSISKINSR